MKMILMNERYLREAESVLPEMPYYCAENAQKCHAWYMTRNLTARFIRASEEHTILAHQFEKLVEKDT